MSFITINHNNDNLLGPIKDLSHDTVRTASVPALHPHYLSVSRDPDTCQLVPGPSSRHIPLFSVHKYGGDIVTDHIQGQV